MRQPCPGCGAQSVGYGAQRADRQRNGPIFTLRLRCKSGHEWQIRLHEDLYELRRARRFSERSKELKGKPFPKGRPPVYTAVQNRTEATPEAMKPLTERAGRGWWE